jgi:putative methyltransferase (TIGR04325 family)
MNTVKLVVTDIIKVIPILSDYYHYHRSFPRETTACRGVFQTFMEASASLPQQLPIGHRQPEIHNHPSISQLTAGRNVGEFSCIDYPVIFWLNAALKDGSTIFDLGGNVGLGYYSFQKYLQYPDDLHWMVCEIPEVAQAGEKLAKEMNSSGLFFTEEFIKAEGANILLTCGTLQYIEASLASSLELLNVKPRHILVNHVPFYEGETFVTLQNIGYAYCPYKIQNRAEFIASLTALNYDLIDSWQFNRTCSIPFHPDRLVRAYHGFYFRLNPSG